MRICHVIPRFDEYGGREKHTYLLVREHILRGHEVKIFTGGNPLTCQRLRDSRVIRSQVYSFSAFTLVLSGEPARVEYKIIPRLPLALLKETFDILHAQDYRHFTTDSAALISRIKKSVLIITIHGFYPPTRYIKKLVRTYDMTLGRKILSRATRIITVSKALKREYGTLFPGLKKKIVAIPNGINVAEYQGTCKSDEFKKRYNLDGWKIIFTGGRLIERKGFQYLIQAMPYVLRECANLKLVITGPDFGYKKRLIELAMRLSMLDHIVFTGMLSDDDFKRALAAADVVMLPSIYEGLPTLLLEGMACQKAVIATNIGGVTEVIQNGLNGLLAEPRDPHGLSRCIVKVLTDEKLARDLGRAAREKAWNYDWSVIAERTLEVYQEALEDRQHNS